MKLKLWLCGVLVLSFGLFAACSENDNGDTPSSVSDANGGSTAADGSASSDSDDSGDGGNQADAESAVDASGGAEDGSDSGPTQTVCRADAQCEDTEYCDTEGDGAAGICVTGCRPGGCDDGQICDDETRICIRDVSCSANSDCRAIEYCDSTGVCIQGCRTGDEDECPRDDTGAPMGCDPATHECTRLVVCCGDDEARSCSTTFPAECSNPIETERDCFSPNPCLFQCQVDADCDAIGELLDDGYFCSANGRCEEGCREDDLGTALDEDTCIEFDKTCDPTVRAENGNGCVRTECVADSDCDAIGTRVGDLFYCAPSDGVCLKGCRNGQGPAADSGESGCAGDLICDANHRCIAESALPECTEDAECSGANEFCVDTFAEANGLGLEISAIPKCEGYCQTHTDCDIEGAVDDDPQSACLTIAEASAFHQYGCPDGGIICDDRTEKVCVFDACRNDDNEPNNDFENATVLGPLDFEQGVRIYDSGNENLVSCKPRDYDYYTFDAPVSGLTIRFSIATTGNDDESTDLDGRIYFKGPGDERPAIYNQYEPDCTFVTPTTANETCTVVNAPQGTWYLRVNDMRGDEGRKPYTIRVELEEGTGPDAAEPRLADGTGGGEDDTPATATFISIDGMRDGPKVIHGRTIHLIEGQNGELDSSDQDWFRFELGLYDNFSVELEMLGNDSADNSDSELTFQVYGPGAPEIGENGSPRLNPCDIIPSDSYCGEPNDGTNLTDAVSLDGYPFLAHNSPPNFDPSSDILGQNLVVQEGVYYIRVTGVTPGQAGRYRLTVNVARYYGLCFDDAVAFPDPTSNNTWISAFNIMNPVALEGAEYMPDDFTYLSIDEHEELIPNRNLNLDGLSLCGDDNDPNEGDGYEDWFEVFLEEGDELTVRVRADAATRGRGDSTLQVFERRSFELLGSTTNACDLRNDCGPNPDGCIQPYGDQGCDIGSGSGVDLDGLTTRNTAYIRNVEEAQAYLIRVVSAPVGEDRNSNGILDTDLTINGIVDADGEDGSENGFRGNQDGCLDRCNSVSSVPRTRIPYTLTLLREAAPRPCPPDIYDGPDQVSDNDVRATATAIGVQGSDQCEEGAVCQLTGTIEDLVLCGSEPNSGTSTAGIERFDEDWFELTLDRVSDVSVSLDYDLRQGSVEVDFYLGDGTTPLNDEGRSDQVDLEGQRPGTYYVRVRSLGAPSVCLNDDDCEARSGCQNGRCIRPFDQPLPGSDVRYDMDVVVNELPDQCTAGPDAFDLVVENDAFVDATLLNSGNDRVDDLTCRFSDADPLGCVDLRVTAGAEDRRPWICDGIPKDEDIYQFRLDRGKGLVVAAFYTFSDEGDMVLEAYDDGAVPQKLIDTRDPSYHRTGVNMQCLVIAPEGNENRTINIRATADYINDVRLEDGALRYGFYVAPLLQTPDSNNNVCASLDPSGSGIVWPVYTRP